MRRKRRPCSSIRVNGQAAARSTRPFRTWDIPAWNERIWAPRISPGERFVWKRGRFMIVHVDAWEYSTLGIVAA